MNVKQLIEKLKEFDENLEVRLDANEGADFIKIDDVYEQLGQVRLYGSMFNLDNYEE